MIGAAALAVEVPFLFFGTPSGHDFEFHLYSWLEAASQWKAGIFLPRWAALANAGCGEPRFLFYPPISWTLGGLISLIFPWKIASCVYIWIALVAAGTSMFALVRRWFERRHAIFAAVLYAVNPYHLVIIYWRSAFAELLAACLLPMLLLWILKAAEKEGSKSWWEVVPLAFILAAAWLTNAPAAIMLHYSLALLVVILAWQRRCPRLLLIGGISVLLGACLAGFYLLPAIYEQRWVTIANAIGEGLRPQDNFLFTHTGDGDHDAFNRVMSWVAALEIVTVLAAAWAAKAWREARRGIWICLAGWGIACAAVTLAPSAILWRVLPKLEFMQFPWRWLLCLGLALAIFVTAGVRRWWMRIAIYAAAVLVIATAWQRIQTPWWDTPADLKEMRDNVGDAIGYEGVEEYTPIGAEPSALESDTRKVRVEGSAHSAIRVLGWNAESKSLTAEMSAADQLALRLFPYPAWQVEVNGREVPTALREKTGQMLVPVEAGSNRVEIRFVRTWDRTLGGWITILTGVGMLGMWIRRRRSSST